MPEGRMAAGDHPANDNECGTETRNDRRPVVEIISTGRSGRSDLFDVALGARRAIRESRDQLAELRERKKSASPAERKFIDREMQGLVSDQEKATRRFRAIEEAMDPPMRVKLWQLIDVDDAWK
jgi:hypothetical protein